jgi:hypothetical protein
MRWLWVVLATLALGACGGGEPVKILESVTPSATPHAALPEPLESELAAIRADPLNSVGFGEKAFTPYEPNEAHALISVRDPAVTARLESEIEGSDDRVYKLALLHVVGKRSDDTVDAALLRALDDPPLSATAAYLLGRAGFKGYAKRPRGDLDAIRAALRSHVADDAPFADPFQRQTFRTGDFALAAYIRLTGPAAFAGVDASTIGYTLPSFDDPARAALIRQIRG